MPHILGPFGPDTALRRFGERLIAAGGKIKKAMKRAAVAVARKFPILLHKLWWKARANPARIEKSQM